MNYKNYERMIVEKYGVELSGWPICGRICNPGTLSSVNTVILKAALANGQCKWIILTEEEADARVQSNQERAESGESVYGPLRKQRARKFWGDGASDDIA
jgi:hypothetical protein